MIDETDELIERVARALAIMPPPNSLATARVVSAVRARRAQAPPFLARVVERLREPRLSVVSAGLLTAAALVMGFVTRGALRNLRSLPEEMTTTAEQSTPVAQTPARQTSNVQGGVRAVSVDIVFEARKATSVAVVGDFNKWDATSSPMQRFGPDGPWTITILAAPGRHVYAFLVDGSTLVADPRAPRARDFDYGGDASVLMVSAR